MHFLTKIVRSKYKSKVPKMHRKFHHLTFFSLYIIKGTFDIFGAWGWIELDFVATDTHILSYVNNLLYRHKQVGLKVYFAFVATLGPSLKLSLAEILANLSLQDGRRSGMIIMELGS